ncbi:hypothetical protein AB9F38_36070, partial [Rhizobium leguminosarum]
DGQHHAVDSSEHAFRTASKMGVRHALSEGSAVLMQPVFRSEIHIPSIYSGSLVKIVKCAAWNKCPEDVPSLSRFIPVEA